MNEFQLYMEEEMENLFKEHDNNQNNTDDNDHCHTPTQEQDESDDKEQQDEEFKLANLITVVFTTHDHGSL